VRKRERVIRAARKLLDIDLPRGCILPESFKLAEYTNSRFALADAAHNYGVVLENRVLKAGATQQEQTTFVDAINAAFAAIRTTINNENLSPTVHPSATIPGINRDENNNPLGNINWGPRIQCVT
jgi:hypothetical protein